MQHLVHMIQFSYREVQIKLFAHLGTPVALLAENINETPAYCNSALILVSLQIKKAVYTLFHFVPTLDSSLMLK